MPTIAAPTKPTIRETNKAPNETKKMKPAIFWSKCGMAASNVGPLFTKARMEPSNANPTNNNPAILRNQPVNLIKAKPTPGLGRRGMLWTNERLDDILQTRYHAVNRL